MLGVGVTYYLMPANVFLSGAVGFGGLPFTVFVMHGHGAMPRDLDEDLFQIRPRIGFAAIRLLEEAGCTVEVPMAQTCCGQPAWNSGDSKEALMCDEFIHQGLVEDSRVTRRTFGLIAAAAAGVCAEAAAPGATVVLSGGTFQNLRLLGSTRRRLEELGFRVLTHRRVPPNDGGISYGQAAVAASARA